jgi:hypothetical protein
MDRGEAVATARLNGNLEMLDGDRRRLACRTTMLR